VRNAQFKDIDQPNDAQSFPDCLSIFFEVVDWVWATFEVYLFMRSEKLLRVCWDF